MRSTTVVPAACLLLAGLASAQMTWTCATESAPWGPRTTAASVVFDGKMWVLGGAEVCGPPEVWANDVWCSINGVDWTCVVESAPWSKRCPSAVVFDNKIWVLGGFINANGDGTNDVWYSSDGASWTCATPHAEWSPRGAHSAAVLGDRMWVVAGVATGGDVRDVWWSTDGVSWTCTTDTAPWLARRYQGLVAFDSRLWLIGGRTFTGEWRVLNDIWASTDGASWICSTDSAEWCPRDQHAVVVHNDTIWLAGGCPDFWMLERSNDVWYSTDGTSWVCADSSAGWAPRACVGGAAAFDGKIWVMGGDSTESSLAMSDVWCSTGLGVEESHQPRASSSKLGPTILSGASGIKRLASCDIFDAMGRRAVRPKPGVYFVREAHAQAVRKVVVTR